ncbi:MAG: hypothetical protein K2I73_02330 [Eubacterium sp.]|nr:hypothetical protein [Eubacterium sp.]
MGRFSLIIAGVLLFLLFILIINAIKQSKYENEEDTNYSPQNNIPKQYHPVYDVDKPILTNHARERMVERLNISGNKQEELMLNAFKYGKDTNRTNGDLRIELEKAERKYDEDSIAKFYQGSIFIFTKEENILKTVYRYDRNKSDYYWH